MRWSFVALSSDYYSQQKETLEYFTDYFSVTRKAFYQLFSLKKQPIYTEIKAQS
jgi:hypothetical protein